MHKKQEPASSPDSEALFKAELKKEALKIGEFFNRIIDSLNSLKQQIVNDLFIECLNKNYIKTHSRSQLATRVAALMDEILEERNAVERSTDISSTSHTIRCLRSKQIQNNSNRLLHQSTERTASSSAQQSRLSYNKLRPGQEFSAFQNQSVSRFEVKDPLFPVQRANVEKGFMSTESKSIQLKTQLNPLETSYNVLESSFQLNRIISPSVKGQVIQRIVTETDGSNKGEGVKKGRGTITSVHSRMNSSSVKQVAGSSGMRRKTTSSLLQQQTSGANSKGSSSHQSSVRNLLRKL